MIIKITKKKLVNNTNKFIDYLLTKTKKTICAY